MGVILNYGEGVEEDAPRAVEHYRKAAERGYAMAQLHLGDLYYNGRPGVPQDLDEACYWLEKSLVLDDAELRYEALSKLRMIPLKRQWGRAVHIISTVVDAAVQFAFRGFVYAWRRWVSAPASATLGVRQ